MSKTGCFDCKSKNRSEYSDIYSDSLPIPAVVLYPCYTDHYLDVGKKQSEREMIQAAMDCRTNVKNVYVCLVQLSLGWGRILPQITITFFNWTEYICLFHWPLQDIYQPYVFSWYHKCHMTCFSSGSSFSAPFCLFSPPRPESKNQMLLFILSCTTKLSKKSR